MSARAPNSSLLQFGRSNPLHLVISAEDKVDRLEACTASLPPVAAEPDAQQEAAAVAAEPVAQQEAAVAAAEPVAQQAAAVAAVEPVAQQQAAAVVD